MEKSAKLKIVSNTTYRLCPFTPGLEALILSWYERKENAEFFRRCPPACDWATLGGIQSLFGSLWVIYEEDLAIGLAGLFNVDRFARSAEFGLLIDKATSKDSRAANIAVCRQISDYVFNYLNFHKIILKLMPWREKLAKHAELQGFTKEVDLRDSIFFNGEYHSEMLYSCLKLEYKGA